MIETPTGQVLDAPLPMVTVLLPLYNGSKVIGPAIDSVRRQNFAGFEMILIDDGSGDETSKVMATWSLRDPRIRTVSHSENRGIARTLNEGIRLARGDFVLILHQDCRLMGDLWLSGALRELSDPSVSAVLGTPYHSTETMEPSEKWFWIIRCHLYARGTEGKRAEDSQLFSENKCDMFRKSTLEELGGFDENVGSGGEDQVLAARMNALGLRAVQSPDLKFELTLGTESGIRKGLRRDLEYGRQMRTVLFRTRAKAVRRDAEGHWDPRLVNRASGLVWIVAVLISILAGVWTGILGVLWAGPAAALLRAMQLSIRASQIRKEYRLPLYQVPLVALLGLGVDLAYAAGWLVPTRRRKLRSSDSIAEST